MKEILEIYDLNDKLIKTEERDKFYSEIRKEFSDTGKATKKIKSIRLLLLNSEGRIYLQKRSKIKSDNPNLYDKTVGGHVPKGYSFEMTVIKECAEELGFPAAVLPPEEFDEAIKATDLTVIGLFKKIDYIPDFDSVRMQSDGSKFVQTDITTIYFGYYDGSIRFKDGESSGIEVFSPDELKNDIRNNPNKYTEDIKIMWEKYKNILKPIS